MVSSVYASIFVNVLSDQSVFPFVYGTDCSLIDCHCTILLGHEQILESLEIFSITFIEVA